MKTKHEQAQALLDGLEQAGDGMLQQAYATDTPERFRALGKLKQIKSRKERPVSALRRWGAVAACLVLILALAVSPWFFSSLLPVITPTEPTEPPTTTDSTIVPTIPSTPSLPNTEIRLQEIMEIWYHADEVHLFCSYFADSDVFYPGQTVSMTVCIDNVGATVLYNGALEDQFGYAELIYEGVDQAYQIPQVERPYTDDATDREFAHLETSKFIYQFVIPQDAPEGNYTLRVSAFGQLIRFDTKATLRPKYVPCLADLSEASQKIVAQASYGSDSYAKDAKSIPVYGEFGDVIVAFWPRFGSAVVTHETVNGLQFQYSSTAHIEVFTPEKVYTLTEAFAAGMLTAEQLKQVHENWLLVGSQIQDKQYDPQIRLINSMQLTHWGQTRLAYIYKPARISYFAGETISIQVDIMNYGPETTYHNIIEGICATATLISDQTGYTLESITKKINGMGPANGTWRTGSLINVVYTFTIPKDFDEGQYTFVFTVGDEAVRFDEESAEEERNMTILKNLGLIECSLFFGKNYRNDPAYINNCHMPVYGQFVGNHDGQWYSASVFIFPTEPIDGQKTILSINGKEFEIPDGYQLHVISEEYGAYTLADAFAAGIITEEMLQEVYNNYIFLQESSTTIAP